MKKKGRSKLGQIWIETVIYTLIAMIMIGAVLAWGKPKIEELQDKSIIEQTLGIFEDIDSQISSVVDGGAGNKRVVEIGLKKGSIKIVGEDDTFLFEIKTKYTYSEPGQDIYIGNIKANTIKKGEYNEVNISLSYDEKYDLRYNYNLNPENEESKTITASSTPYNLIITNTGLKDGDHLILNVELN